MTPLPPRLLRLALAAGSLQAAGAVLGFALNIVVARTLGAEGAGVYFLAASLVTVASLLARAGLEGTLLRFSAAHAAAADWASVKGVAALGLRFACLSSLAVTLLLIALAPLLAVGLFQEPSLRAVLMTMAPAVLPLSLVGLYAQLLKGLSRVASSVALQYLWGLFFTLVGFLLFVPPQDVGAAAGVHVAAALGTLGLGFWMWQRVLKPYRLERATFPLQTLLASSAPLFVSSLSGLVITYASTLFLGVWGSSREVALFNVANRTALLISFVLLAVNTVVAPQFAALYAQGQLQRLAQTVRRAVNLTTALALPALLPCLLFPARLMGLFGESFAEGGTVLMILALGQFLNVITGSVSLLLVMCGQERLLRNLMSLSAGGVILLNVLLIPPFGLLGAAWASALSLGLQNGLMAYYVWRSLGIVSLPSLRLPRLP